MLDDNKSLHRQLEKLELALLPQQRAAYQQSEEKSEHPDGDDEYAVSSSGIRARVFSAGSIETHDQGSEFDLFDTFDMANVRIQLNTLLSNINLAWTDDNENASASLEEMFARPLQAESQEQSACSNARSAEQPDESSALLRGGHRDSSSDYSGSQPIATDDHSEGTQRALLIVATPIDGEKIKLNFRYMTKTAEHGFDSESITHEPNAIIHYANYPRPDGIIPILKINDHYYKLNTYSFASPTSDKM